MIFIVFLIFIIIILIITSLINIKYTQTINIIEKINISTQISNSFKHLPNFNGKILITMGDCYENIYNLITTAKKQIIYSCFAGNLMIPLPFKDNKYNLKTIFNKKAIEGVDITIIYNTTEEYDNHPIQYLKQILHQNIKIYTVTASSHIHEYIQNLVNQKYYSYNHMKFLIADNQIQIGGCDIDKWGRKGYMKLNKNNYSWHEIGIQTHCSNSFKNWIQYFINSKTISIKNILPPPLPYLNNYNEYYYWTQMIKNAKNIIYCEQQFLAFTILSTNRTKHILNALANRIVKSCLDNCPLKVIFITNIGQHDEFCQFVIYYTNTSINLHITSLIKQVITILSKHNIDYDKAIQLFEQRVFYSYLKDQTNHIIKVHSNILITDDINHQWHAIRSSSNGSDRSFGDSPCDIELGIYFKGPHVYNTLLKLMRLHTNNQSIKNIYQFYNIINNYIYKTNIIKIIPNYDIEYIKTFIIYLLNIHPSSGNCNHKMIINKIR